jgi:hypothetical protein
LCTGECIDSERFVVDVGRWWRSDSVAGLAVAMNLIGVTRFHYRVQRFEEVEDLGDRGVG